MSKFKETFGENPVLLPVIHIENERQVLKNVEIAQNESCKGAFLISMNGMKYDGLLKMHAKAKSEFPDFWLGVNFLDLEAHEVFQKLNEEIGGVWVDNARINETYDHQVEAENIAREREESGWEGLYFGGVAFKYQDKVSDVAKAAKIAADLMDVVTTSGSKTGTAPDIQKITLMKQSVGYTPLAVASGISPENVGRFKNIADCFLTASSILIPGTENFDPQRIKNLQSSLL